MSIAFKKSFSKVALILIFLFSAVQVHSDADPCSPFLVAQKLEKNYPASKAVVEELIAFAKENNLPIRTMLLGPPERKVERVFVAVNAQNEALLARYRERFQLEQGSTGEHAGTLVLEFANEVQDGMYVTGAVRRWAAVDHPIYRWGRPDISLSEWWSRWVMGNAYHPANSKNEIYGFAHLVGLSPKETDNVKFYLEHSNVNNRDPAVAPCKNSNCVAWTSSIELGKSYEGALDVEREFLFNSLGMARSSAHFEIGRRLIHAANQRHAAIVAFVDGEKGLKQFKSLEQYLMPEPQIPYSSILKDFSVGKEWPPYQAIEKLPDGSKVFFPIAAGASPEAFMALGKYAETLKKGLTVDILVNGVSEATLNSAIEQAGKKLKLRALFLGGNVRQLYREGKVAVIPGYLGDFPKWVTDPNKSDFHYDGIVVRVSPPDANGKMSLGPNNDMVMTILEARPDIKIIAEVNENIPRTHGNNFIYEHQITARFDSKAKLAGPPVVPLTQVEIDIGNQLGQIINFNSTLQIGIGNIFGGLPAGLRNSNKTGLKIFTEMFGDPLMNIMQDGIATEAKTGFAYGSENLYNWLNGNQAVEFVPTLEVNDPGAVSRMENFHAVNTALQINLRGDVNATHGPDGKRMSSPGGQVEFMSGAARSKGGKAIIAIRSTAKNGTLSSITLDLYGGSVTTTHENVTHVVTEYGIAELQGKSEPERAMALIRIAHPNFRMELLKEARKREMITQYQYRKLFKEFNQ